MEQSEVANKSSITQPQLHKKLAQKMFLRASATAAVSESVTWYSEMAVEEESYWKHLVKTLPYVSSLMLLE